MAPEYGQYIHEIFRLGYIFVGLYIKDNELI